MILMTFTKLQEDTLLYTELTLPVFGLLTLVGALAAIAMIIPGISGAFLLLIIGFHHTFVQSVSGFNIPLLIPIVLGACGGLLLGAAFVRFLLSKVPKQTHGAVLGLVTGSIIVLYVQYLGSFGEGIEIIFSVLLLLLGFAVSFFTRKLNLKQKQTEK
jgi:putative membrane protein